MVEWNGCRRRRRRSSSSSSSSSSSCVRGTTTQPLICVGFSVHYWVSCEINKGGFFEIAFVVVDTHLPRFEAHAYGLPHCDALTHLVIRVTFQYTQFKSCHPPGVKKGFVKGEGLRLLRTYSLEETFVENIRIFKLRLRKYSCDTLAVSVNGLSLFIY